MKHNHRGIGNPMYGKHHTQKTKDKIRKLATGRIVSIQTRTKMSAIHRSQCPWNKGMKMSDSFRRAISLALAKCKYKFSGSNHYNWRGGVTPLRTRLWFSPQYKKWRQQVFQNNNYTCQMCGAESGNGKTIKLEADHYPISFVVYLEKIKELTMGKNMFEFALSYEKLWKASGRTLCKPCHDTTKWGRATLRAQEQEMREARY
jgi:hypothetical protein